MKNSTFSTVFLHANGVLLFLLIKSDRHKCLSDFILQKLGVLKNPARLKTCQGSSEERAECEVFCKNNEIF